MAMELEIRPSCISATLVDKLTKVGVLKAEEILRVMKPEN